MTVIQTELEPQRRIQTTKEPVLESWTRQIQNPARQIPERVRQTYLLLLLLMPQYYWVLALHQSQTFRVWVVAPLHYQTSHRQRERERQSRNQRPVRE